MTGIRLEARAKPLVAQHSSSAGGRRGHAGAVQRACRAGRGRCPHRIFQAFLSSLSTAFNRVETVVKAAPLVFTGLAVTVAFRAKFWNIGAEGQLLAGAMAAAFIGAREGLPAWSLVPLMIAGGALAGSVWALVPAMLKTRFKVDDVVTSLLLNFVLFYGMMALLDGPWKDPLSGYPDSPDIRLQAEFPILLRATRLHLGVLLAALAAAGVWLMLCHTTLGFEIDAVGENPNAARYAGINLAAVTLFTAAVSGALAGLAGVGKWPGFTSRSWPACRRATATPALSSPCSRA